MGKAASDSADALARFFAGPTEAAFIKASRRARRLRRRLLKVREGTAVGLPRQRLEVQHSGNLGVPFPLAQVLVPQEAAVATLQLKSGFAMPLLALAMRPDARPSITDITDALRLGMRHLEVAPATAEAVGRAVKASGVARDKLFLSVPWELPLDSEDRFDVLLAALGTRLGNKKKA